MEHHQMEDNQALLGQQLGVIDESLRFLVLIILSVLLSFWSVILQRRQLTDALEGKRSGQMPILPLKCMAGALVIGSLSYFFALALETWQSAQESQDAAVQSSADRSLWASLFVLVAALIRMYDLNSSQPPADREQPL